MKHIPAILFSLFSAGLFAQTVSNAIPGDNVLRFYRLAIPVTKSAFEEDFNSDYNEVLSFWQECEGYINEIYVPAGFCFNVIADDRLVMRESNLIDESIYNATSFGTELVDEVIGSAAYDVAMWVSYRPSNSENTGLSVQNGVYSHSTKGSGYAKPDCWVVAHEVGHLFGAAHTMPGEGSLMDNIGDFFSYPSLKEIREASMERNAAYYSDEGRTQLVGANAGGNYVYGVKVENEAPVFVAEKMKSSYRIPQGACLAVELHAADKENDELSYMSEGYDVECFASLPPQKGNVIDYRPKYSADIYYEYYYSVTGTDIPSLQPGRYGVRFFVNDLPGKCDYSSMKNAPFYCGYNVWEAGVEIVGGAPFTASLSPAKNSYAAGERVTVSWGVNNNYFTADSRLRITMSSDYGRSFEYVLAESVPALDGSCSVTLPPVNVENVDVDFITAVRSMPGGIIRLEEVGGAAYTLTALSPEDGSSFNVTGGADVETKIEKLKDEGAKSEEQGRLGEVKGVYDLTGRKVVNPGKGVYIIDGRKVLVR